MRRLRPHLLRQFLAQNPAKAAGIVHKLGQHRAPRSRRLRRRSFTPFEQALRQHNQFLDLDQQTGDPEPRQRTSAINKLPNQAVHLAHHLTSEQNLGLLNPSRLGVGSQFFQRQPQ